MIINFPPNLTINNHDVFLLNAISAIRRIGGKIVNFDFRYLIFIDTASAVSILNFIAYLNLNNYEIKFINFSANTKAKKYLLDAGFFDLFDLSLNEAKSKRSTTTNFFYFEETQFNGYLFEVLTPWIEASANIPLNTLDVVRTTLEEVFHNINYHSHVRAGFTCAQHFPKKNEIHIAVADYGTGIPKNVRKFTGREMSDVDAIELACQNGFSSKSSTHNRGVGLYLLIQQIVKKNRGHVRIQSGNGVLTVSPSGANEAFLEKATTKTYYSGTLVLISLRTDTLEQFIEEADSEDFAW